jgi:hypothetical protein
MTTTQSWKMAARGLVFAFVFSAGYLMGTTQAPAQAQLGELGKEMGSGLLEQAAGSEGMLGQVTQLGTTIIEMEEHVTALQKNLDTLNTVKAALGGS